jgi:hypothetical protein
MPAVNTFNECDPLEEIVVGVVADARIPRWETVSPAVIHFETIGEGFHCASVDIRRRGTLQSYFTA